MAQTPFHRGSVRRASADEIGQQAISVVHVTDALDEAMAMLDGIIASQPDGRHYVSSYAQTVLRSVGIRLGVWISADEPKAAKAAAADLPDKDADPVGYAKRRIAELTRKGHAIPRSFVLIADGVASTWDEAAKIEKAERAATTKPAAKAPRAKRGSLKALTTTRAE